MSVCCLGVVQFAHANDPCRSGTGFQLSSATDAPWTMQIQFNPKDVSLNTPFDLMVAVCSQSEHLPSHLTIDATMPAHKHGMNYEPKTEYAENRQYRSKNLLFHMPGIWRIEVTAFHNSKPYRFTLDVDIQ
ncbi:MAG: hypothetical protein ABJO54_10505 [Hyphomicrobiales bacterium]